MKCPKRMTIIQKNLKNYRINEDNQLIGETQLFAEIQDFGECYKENCAAWDKEKKICKEGNL